MFFGKSIFKHSKDCMAFSAYLVFLAFAACSNLTDDLFPDERDLRQEQTAINDDQTTPIYVPNFNIIDSKGNQRRLSVLLQEHQAIVFYFTMWCSVCDNHIYIMRRNIMPNFTQVKFLVVDYVNQDIQVAEQSRQNSSLAGSDIVVIVDDGSLQDYFSATMGTTVIVVNDRTLIMKEDFKDGSRLIKRLQELY